MVNTLSYPHPTDLPSHSQGFKPEEKDHHDPLAISQEWLSTFAEAATSGDGELFQSLFVTNGYWRDILAFTNDYRSIRTANVGKAASVSLSLNVQAGWLAETTRLDSPLSRPKSLP